MDEAETGVRGGHAASEELLAGTALGDSDVATDETVEGSGACGGVNRIVGHASDAKTASFKDARYEVAALPLSGGDEEGHFFLLLSA
jgi:hypothetical protein